MAETACLSCFPGAGRSATPRLPAAPPATQLPQMLAAAGLRCVLGSCQGLAAWLAPWSPHRCWWQPVSKEGQSAGYCAGDSQTNRGVLELGRQQQCLPRAVLLGGQPIRETADRAAQLVCLRFRALPSPLAPGRLQISPTHDKSVRDTQSPGQSAAHPLPVFSDCRWPTWRLLPVAVGRV